MNASNNIFFEGNFDEFNQVHSVVFDLFAFKKITNIDTQNTKFYTGGFNAFDIIYKDFDKILTKDISEMSLSGKGFYDLPVEYRAKKSKRI